MLLLTSLQPNSFGTRIQLYATKSSSFPSSPPPPAATVRIEHVHLFLPDPPPPPMPACAPHRVLSGDQGRLRTRFCRSGARLACPRPPTARLSRSPPLWTHRPLLFGATGWHGEAIRSVLDRPLLLKMEQRGVSRWAIKLVGG